MYLPDLICIIGDSLLCKTVTLLGFLNLNFTITYYVKHFALV